MISGSYRYHCSKVPKAMDIQVELPDFEDEDLSGLGHRRDDLRV